MKRLVLSYLLLGGFALPAAAQNYLRLDGTTQPAFKIGLASPQLTLTNTAGTLSMNSGLTVSGGTINFSGATVSNGGAITTIDINGGTIDGAAIGGSSASTGAFTTLASSGVYTNTVSTGTAPFTISSTTLVSNLNAAQVDTFSLTGGSNGGICYQQGSANMQATAAGTTGHLVASGGSGAPTFVGLPSANLFVGNGSGVPAAAAMTGDVAISNTGVTTLQSGAITGAEIANDAVTAARIAQGTAGQVLMSNVTPDTAWVTLTGNVTVDSGGVTAIGASQVTAAMLANAVADEIVTATPSAGAEAANVIRVTLQAKDVQGNNVSGTKMVAWHLGDSGSVAAETAQSPTVAYVNGAAWQTVTADKKAWAFTDANGALILDVTLVGDVTIHAIFAVAGKVYSQTLDFN